jgi:D-sedoheptulose 7-phosphate isomerase|tara:strand:- start:28449 stop:29009 length:561 start_codon:yes stop_codon:yes gene_type:complete
MSKKIISESIFKHIEVAKNIDQNLIQKASDILISTIKSGNSVFWIGNGGSASQANHLSAELVGGMFKNKKSPFRSICLNTDTAFITAWSNDDTFDNIFTRQLEAIANPNDLIIMLSTSGNSVNIINAAKYAANNKLKSISLTGNDGGELKNLSNLNINIADHSTQRIQEMHIIIGHIICELVENSL